MYINYSCLRTTARGVSKTNARLFYVTKTKTHKSKSILIPKVRFLDNRNVKIKHVTLPIASFVNSDETFIVY